MKVKKVKINKKNMKKIAKQSKKPNTLLFLLITAPWCFHCKEMKPEYHKMLKNIKNVPSNVIIGNIEDNIMNDFDLDTKINGFPTFRLYGGGKKIKDYNGPRDSENLMKFVKKNCKYGGKKTMKRKHRKKRKYTRKKSKSKKKYSLKQKFYDMISSKY